MLRLAFLLGVALTLLPLETNAQTNRSSSCSVTQVLKLLDAGYTKKEIEGLCQRGSQSGSQNRSQGGSQGGSQVTAPQPPKQPKPDLAMLNGTWAITSDCSPYSGVGNKITVSAGKITGWIFFGVDDLILSGQFSPDGSAEFFGSGKWVIGTFNGRVTDWPKGAANGTLSVGGEGYCDGTWLMKKVS